MKTTTMRAAAVFAALAGAMLAAGLVAVSTPAGATDLSDDPHIAGQLERERAAMADKWALRAMVLGGISASESDVFVDGDTPVSLDGIAGDDWFAGGRVTLECSHHGFFFGPLVEAGLFSDSSSAFRITGLGSVDFSADWYWKAGAIAGFEVLPGAAIYGTLAYGEIETGEITLVEDKLGDPDLSGLVYGAGVRLEVAPRVYVFGEVNKWHDVGGDAGDVGLDSDIVQGLAGISVKLN
jgi:hypothetical protein